MPGVDAGGLVNAPPLSGLDANGAFMFDGQAWDEIKDNWTAQSAVYRMASDGYFAAMGMDLRRGRTFDSRDVSGAEAVAVVNEALARRYFAGRDPLGQRIRFAGMDLVNPWLTIVGVVGDVRFRDLAVESVPEVFVNFRQLPMRTQYSVTTAVRVRPGLAPESVATALREEWRQLDPDVPVEVSRMTTLVDRSTASRRFTLTVVGGFGIMALALAAMGVYGILSYSVAQRSREIGIRMALGASSRSVISLVFRSVTGAVGLGVIGGVLAAVALTRFLQCIPLRRHVARPADVWRRGHGPDWDRLPGGVAARPARLAHRPGPGHARPVVTSTDTASRLFRRQAEALDQVLGIRLVQEQEELVDEVERVPHGVRVIPAAHRHYERPVSALDCPGDVGAPPVEPLVRRLARRAAHGHDRVQPPGGRRGPVQAGKQGVERQGAAAGIEHGAHRPAEQPLEVERSPAAPEWGWPEAAEHAAIGVCLQHRGDRVVQW